ncbi:hypothetical protein GCM10008986_33530 [Salinibacillus aidingensis]|uniref:DUF1832 domain-containing protein n=1 Tax=Salinibacillus aidingensis TaxID=237684 RepID=A0ABN1BQF0_9BACI
MSNKRMHLSAKGKEILDLLSENIEVERPQAVKIALAKGLSISNGPILEDYSQDKNKWTIPDNIIKDKEYLLFKHLIINEIGSHLAEDQINNHMLAYIEKGLREIEQIINNKSSLEDLRIAIL